MYIGDHSKRKAIKEISKSREIYMNYPLPFVAVAQWNVSNGIAAITIVSTITGVCVCKSELNGIHGQPNGMILFLETSHASSYNTSMFRINLETPR
ncbi:hypothetical protein TNCV_4683641 [Trichonephila clavipes]|nr:hypothetical protein TNCV_4683641 [Trichonephila clavipes]